MPIPVLATKLFAPARRSQIIARARLSERLDTTLEVGHRLTLVSAPAGFGKTTGLSDWIAHLDQHPARPQVAWLSLDNEDNDLNRFLTHALAALHGISLGLDSNTPEYLETAPVPAVLTALVNDISRASDMAPEQHWVLVLDDYHVIQEPGVHSAVNFLLEHLPDHLKLVIASREDPPLLLTRLRSRGQLTEVRAVDLRFTADEASAFLNQAMGLDLTTADVHALEERTEGWIAGLQLAALSLRDVSDNERVATFIAEFTGSNRFVIDYLVEEVLARQPVETRAFLLDTSVLDRLTGPLCEAVTGRSGGAATLETLERSNLFLVPLDAQRSWYRYHHLFGDVLRARLLAERPELVATLHRRASDWFSSRGMTNDAVRHALAAEDFDRAAYLMEEAVPELRRTRQDGVLLAWSRSLPDSVVRRRPVLSILAASSALISGDLDAVESRLDDADAALAAGDHDPAVAASWADTHDLRTAAATVAVFRASAAQARGDVTGTVQHARRALDLAAPEDHLARAGGSGFLGLAAWAAGDVSEALSTFGEARKQLKAAGNVVDELGGTIVMGDLHVASGRPGRARRLYEQALRSATDGGRPYPPGVADLYVGLSELDRELGDFAGAEAHLQEARTLGEHASITENRHRWFVAMGLLSATRGDYESAADLLDRAQELYIHGFYPDVRPVRAMKVRVHIAGGDLESAIDWSIAVGIGEEDQLDYLREYEHLTLARLLIARDRDSQTEAIRPSDLGSRPHLVGALRLLDRLHTSATASDRQGSLLEIEMLQAISFYALGDETQALITLSRSLAAAPEPENYVRLFLDEGPPMLALLRRAASSGHQTPQEAASGSSDNPDPDQALSEWARRRIALTTTTVLDDDSQQSLPDALSRRELEVLRLLGTDLTGPEIARELYVTVNTLRTHTKRIFTKLDANTRAVAVQRARDLGLL